MRGRRRCCSRRGPWLWCGLRRMDRALLHACGRLRVWTDVVRSCLRAGGRSDVRREHIAGDRRRDTRCSWRSNVSAGPRSVRAQRGSGIDGFPQTHRRWGGRPGARPGRCVAAAGSRTRGCGCGQAWRFRGTRPFPGAWRFCRVRAARLNSLPGRHVGLGVRVQESGRLGPAAWRRAGIGPMPRRQSARLGILRRGPKAVRLRKWVEAPGRFGRTSRAPEVIGQLGEVKAREVDCALARVP